MIYMIILQKYKNYVPEVCTHAIKNKKNTDFLPSEHNNKKYKQNKIRNKASSPPFLIHDFTKPDHFNTNAIWYTQSITRSIRN